ncbi:MAG: hypothetical protein ACK2TX_10385, partial [Anaerolineales bacterium]
YWVVGAAEVWINAADGNEIHGLHWPAPKGRPTILFFHGNAQTVFEWALILLSSLSGAILIAQGLELDRAQALLVFGLVFLVGLIVQAAWLRADRRREVT